jgi:alkyldihydroxyacetonephosphate synthase
VASPTPPIELTVPAQARSRLEANVEVPEPVVAALRSACAEVTVEPAATAEASRDWWPLGMAWALDGMVPGLAGVVCRPSSAAEVADVLRVCHDGRVPVTPAAGRSGVCGASVPAFGGVVLDLTGLQGIVDVDDISLTVDVLPGTFGHELEAELRAAHGLTLGHWPQSIELSTVGGWLACRSAGQYSTRYGKIEDMVVGLDVALADGRRLTTGGNPRQAVGPDLTQLFVGSEGTLGVITGARLRAHPAPPAEARAAYGFPTFRAGLDACRRILRQGATPAVLRLYDEAESRRSYATEGINVLLVLDEGDPAIVDATLAVVRAECDGVADRLDDALVEQWLHHRNDVSALEPLTRKGFVVDTMEIAAPWSRLPAIYEATTAALLAVPHTVAATAHQSHSYGDGACLYFTFAARPPADEREATYVALWDAGTKAVLAGGGALSHHHGVGLNRARFVADALGGGFEVLRSVKDALDPRGILNPGKLGLPSPFGEVAWP